MFQLRNLVHVSTAPEYIDADAYFDSGMEDISAFLRAWYWNTSGYTVADAQYSMGYSSSLRLSRIDESTWTNGSDARIIKHQGNDYFSGEKLIGGEWKEAWKTNASIYPFGCRWYRGSDFPSDFSSWQYTKWRSVQPTVAARENGYHWFFASHAGINKTVLFVLGIPSSYLKTGVMYNGRNVWLNANHIIDMLGYERSMEDHDPSKGSGDLYALIWTGSQWAQVSGSKYEYVSVSGSGEPYQCTWEDLYGNEVRVGNGSQYSSNTWYSDNTKYPYAGLYNGWVTPLNGLNSIRYINDSGKESLIDLDVLDYDIDVSSTDHYPFVMELPDKSGFGLMFTQFTAVPVRLAGDPSETSILMPWNKDCDTWQFLQFSSDYDGNFWKQRSRIVRNTVRFIYLYRETRIYGGSPPGIQFTMWIVVENEDETTAEYEVTTVADSEGWQYAYGYIDHDTSSYYGSSHVPTIQRVYTLNDDEEEVDFTDYLRIDLDEMSVAVTPWYTCPLISESGPAVVAGRANSQAYDPA